MSLKPKFQVLFAFFAASIFFSCSFICLSSSSISLALIALMSVEPYSSCSSFSSSFFRASSAGVRFFLFCNSASSVALSLSASRLSLFFPFASAILFEVSSTLLPTSENAAASANKAPTASMHHPTGLVARKAFIATPNAVTVLVPRATAPEKAVVAAVQLVSIPM